jgi:hypothetical protein
MDWNRAIERNREALKRVVAALAAMAGLGNRQSAIASRQSESGLAQAADGPTPADCLLPTADCRLLLPRRLHRAVLRLLRPAEAAARRLVIVAARGLVVELPPARPRKQKPKSAILRGRRGAGIIPPRNTPHPEVRAAGEPRRAEVRSGRTPAARAHALPLFDPLRRPPRHRRPAASGVPRISVPGFSEPFAIPVRRHPRSPDDAIDATRLALRLQALASALDDLPRQARRFARWRAARDAAGAQNGQRRDAGRIRRAWPLRPARPPGWRRRPTHEIHDILTELHNLAFEALESPDTS